MRNILICALGTISLTLYKLTQTTVFLLQVLEILPYCCEISNRVGQIMFQETINTKYQLLDKLEP